MRNRDYQKYRNQTLVKFGKNTFLTTPSKEEEIRLQDVAFATT